MCSDHGPILLVRGDQEESLAEISTIQVVAEGLKLVDVYGKSHTILGRISEIDLLGRRVVIA